MGFVVAPGVARVEMIYLHHLQFVENVFHVQVDPTGPLTEAELDAVRDTFRLWHVNNLRSQQTTAAILQRIEVRDMTAADALAKVYPCTVNCAGTFAGTGTPGGTTIAIKWTTGYAGRSRRGRTYHIGMGVNMITANQINAGTQASLQTAYTALITACNAASTPLVVYSRHSGGVDRDIAVITPIASASVDANIDSMRRRLTGEGRGT